MAHIEMTIAEVLNDPLIQQMMRADRVSPEVMKKLLQDAASAQNRLRSIRHTSGDEIENAAPAATRTRKVAAAAISPGLPEAKNLFFYPKRSQDVSEDGRAGLSKPS